MFYRRKIVDVLTKFPHLKRAIKNAYGNLGNLLSDKTSVPKDLRCVSDPQYENLFGYYDKSPWNRSSNKMVYLRVSDAYKNCSSNETAEIVAYDCALKTETVIAQTRSWNVQQGCMLNWYGDSDDTILYNDFQDGNYVAIIYNFVTDEKRILPMPIYSLSSDGKTAVTLDFSRLESFRPGYGYCNLPDKTKTEYCPDKTAIWYMNTETMETTPVCTYKQLYSINTKATMEQAYHKINHIMLSPDGSKYIFLQRWIKSGVKYDRLLINKIGFSESLRILLDDGMVSHSNWRDNDTVITYARTTDKGDGYYLIDVNSGEITSLSAFFPGTDGHPSFSPNGKYVITDTYPDFKRKQHIYLIDMESQIKTEIASVYANKRYKNETRCDLHPRWKRDGSEICFDGAQLKKRQVWALGINMENI